MFLGRISRQKVKKGLIATTIALATILLLLVLYGFISVRPRHLSMAIELGQHYEFSSDNLPEDENQIVEEDNDNDLSKIIAQPQINDKPKIAILVTNLGLNKNATELAISLPKEVSLGFLPYTSSLKYLYEKALKDQHEMFVYLPFETRKYPMDFPGHMPILKNAANEENINRLNALLNNFEGYQGVYASFKESFTEDAIKSAPIINELNQRNLSLFLGREDASQNFHGEKNIKTFSADIILDIEPNVSDIKENLDKLVEIAKANKTAIAYAESYPVTIYTLKAWIPMLKERNIELVPVSHIMRQKHAK